MNIQYFIICALLAGAAAHPLTAANKIWDGGGDGVSWDDPLNWSDDLAPVQIDANTDSVTNMIGADVIIDSAAPVGKLENGGITGGTLTIGSTGSLSALGSIEINRRNGGGTLTVDGGSVSQVDSSSAVTFVSHYADNDAPETGISEGTLRVINGGAYTTGYFRSDGGVSNIIIEGSNSQVSTIRATNNTFANSDTATTHLQIIGDSTTKLATNSGRDYWGGVGATMTINGGQYTHAGDQLGLSQRAGGDNTISITNGGLLETDATVYTAGGAGASSSIEIDGGTLRLTNASRDLNIANGAGSDTSINVKGAATFDITRNVSMQSGNISSFTIEGDAATITIGSQFQAGNAASTLGFILGESGASLVTVGNGLTITGSTLVVDLAAYDAGTYGDATQLFAFGSLSGTFGTVTFLNGSGIVDYATPNQLWIRDITVVPEPGAFALLAGLTGLSFVALRRRR